MWGLGFRGLRVLGVWSFGVFRVWVCGFWGCGGLGRGLGVLGVLGVLGFWSCCNLGVIGSFVRLIERHCNWTTGAIHEAPVQLRQFPAAGWYEKRNLAC